MTIDVIQSLPHLIVFRNRLYLKDTAQVAEPAFFLQPSLKFENGRVLKEHHGKSGHQAVMELMIEFALLTQVLDCKKVFAKRLSQRVKLQVLFWMQLASPYIDHFGFYSAIYGVQCLNFRRDLFQHIIALKKN